MSLWNLFGQAALLNWLCNLFSRKSNQFSLPASTYGNHTAYESWNDDKELSGYRALRQPEAKQHLANINYYHDNAADDIDLEQIADGYDDSDIDDLQAHIDDLEDMLDECDEMSDNYDLIQDEINRLQAKYDRMEDVDFDIDVEIDDFDEDSDFGYEESDDYDNDSDDDGDW